MVRTQPSNSHTNAIFPIKLHWLLSEAETNGLDVIISWLPCGKLFKVHDTARFASEIMPTYFGSSKYRSFQKNLNMWGFKALRGKINRGACSHPFFMRNSIYLCHRMVRRCVYNSNYPPTKSLQDEEEEEPGTPAAQKKKQALRSVMTGKQAAEEEPRGGHDCENNKANHEQKNGLVRNPDSAPARRSPVLARRNAASDPTTTTTQVASLRRASASVAPRGGLQREEPPLPAQGIKRRKNKKLAQAKSALSPAQLFSSKVVPGSQHLKQAGDVCPGTTSNKHDVTVGSKLRCRPSPGADIGSGTSSPPPKQYSALPISEALRDRKFKKVGVKNANVTSASLSPAGDASRGVHAQAGAASLCVATDSLDTTIPSQLLVHKPFAAVAQNLRNTPLAVEDLMLAQPSSFGLAGPLSSLPTTPHLDGRTPAILSGIAGILPYLSSSSSGGRLPPANPLKNPVTSAIVVGAGGGLQQDAADMVANTEYLHRLLVSLQERQKSEMALLQQQQQPSILQSQLQNLIAIRSRKLSLTAELDRLQNMMKLKYNSNKEQL